MNIKAIIAGFGLAAGALATAGIAAAGPDGGDGGSAAFTKLSDDLFGDSSAKSPTDGAFADTFSATGLGADESNAPATSDWDQFNGDLAAWEDKSFLSAPNAFDVSLVNDFNNGVGYLEEGLFDLSGHGYNKTFSHTIDGSGVSGLQDIHFTLGDGGALSESFSNIDTAGFDLGDLFGGGTL